MIRNFCESTNFDRFKMSRQNTRKRRQYKEYRIKRHNERINAIRAFYKKLIKQDISIYQNQKSTYYKNDKTLRPLE
jgi:hypothetical protein